MTTSCWRLLLLLLFLYSKRFFLFVLVTSHKSNVTHAHTEADTSTKQVPPLDRSFTFSLSLTLTRILLTRTCVFPILSNANTNANTLTRACKHFECIYSHQKQTQSVRPIRHIFNFSLITNSHRLFCVHQDVHNTKWCPVCKSFHCKRSQWAINIDLFCCCLIFCALARTLIYFWPIIIFKKGTHSHTVLFVCFAVFLCSSLYLSVSELKIFFSRISFCRTKIQIGFFLCKYFLFGSFSGSIMRLLWIPIVIALIKCNYGQEETTVSEDLIKELFYNSTDTTFKSGDGDSSSSSNVTPTDGTRFSPESSSSSGNPNVVEPTCSSCAAIDKDPTLKATNVSPLILSESNEYYDFQYI